MTELGFYYPGQMWHDDRKIKNYLLFFEGLALLVPKSYRRRLGQGDSVLFAPLQEQGLLHVLDPEDLVDQAATEQLASVMVEVISSGALDALTPNQESYQFIDRCRTGHHRDRGLAGMITDELEHLGLAYPPTDGPWIKVHPAVRNLFLVLLAQILRPQGQRLGLDLSPVTDQDHVVRALIEFFSLPVSPSSGRIVALDLETVGVDLSSVPLDEVLSFRERFGPQYRRYAQSVRGVARDLTLVSRSEVDLELDNRQGELRDLAADLRRVARREWKRPASLGLTLAGTVWTLVSGDPLGAILAATAAMAGSRRSEEVEVGVYSYLFSTKEAYP